MESTTRNRLVAVISNPLCCATCLLVASACGGSSQGEQVRDARMQRAEERADVQVERVDEQQAARDKAIDRRYDEYQKQAEAGDRPGAASSKELIEVSKDRAEYQSDARGRVDKLGVRMNELRQKVQVMGARVPHTLQQELQTASKEYDLADREVTQLDTVPADQWDRATQQLEDDQADLSERLDKIEDQLDEYK